MKKETIAKKLKENKKLLLIFSVIFISGLIIGISISTINLSNPKKYYVAVDDIGIASEYTQNPFDDLVKLTYYGNSVYFGCSQLGTATPDYHGFIIRFDLRNKPKSWSKCEISLYVYKKVRNVCSASIYLFGGNWTEEEWDGYGNYMGDFEIYWKIEDSVGGVSNSVGFHRTDITEYIDNITTETFSIAVLPRRLYDGLGYIYSSEWDGVDPMFPYILPESDSYKNYLPQLIWS